MKKSLFLFIMLFWVASSWATINTKGGGKWSNMSIQATDTLIITGTTPDTIDGSFTLVDYKRPESNTNTQVETGTTIITLTGNGMVWNDSGTIGAKTYPDSIALTGNGTMKISAGSGAITATNTILNFVGTDTTIFGLAITIKRFYVATGLLNSNTAALTTSGTGPLLIMDASSSFTSNGTIIFICNASSNIFSLSGIPTINGNGAMTVNANAANDTIGIDTMIYSGSGALAFRDGSTGSNLTGVVFNLLGNLSAAALSFTVARGTSDATFNTNNYNITTSGAFLYGITGANTTSSLNVNFGSSIISVASSAVTASYANGAAITIDMGSSKWIVAGNMNLLSNATYDVGTSIVTVVTSTGTPTITSNGKHFYDLKDSCVSATLTFADAPYIDNDFTIIEGATTWAGFTLTCGGDVVIDGSRAHNFGTGITMTGNSALFHVGSTVGTVTATSCVLDWEGTSGTIDDDKAVTFKSFTLGSGKSLTSSGASTTSFTGAGPLITFTNGGSLTQNTRIDLNLTGGTSIMSVTGSPTWTTGASMFVNANVNSALDLPGFTNTGTGNFVIRAGTNSPTINQTGNISVGANFQVAKNAGASTTLTYNTANCGIACGAKLIFGSNAGTTTTVNLGSSTISCVGYDEATVTGGTTNINLQTAKITNSGNWNSNSAYTTDRGTSIVRQTPGSGIIDTITSAGKPFWSFRMIGNSTGTVYLADSLTAKIIRDTSGKFDQNSKPIYIDSIYQNVSPDSLKANANYYLGGSYERNTNAVYRTAGAMYFDTTRAHTLTANGAQLGPVYCKNITITDSVKIQKLTVSDSGTVTFQASVGVRVDTVGKLNGSSGKLTRYLSSIAGTAARLWVDAYTASYSYFKDIFSKKAPINAGNGTNTNGTGNTNIIWPTCLTSISYASSPKTFTIGSADSMAVAVSSCAPDSFVVIGTPLPAAVTINKTSGLLTFSGAAPAVESASYTILAYSNIKTDSASATITFSIVSACTPALVLSPATGDTMGNTLVLFLAHCGGLTATTCSEVDSYTILTDSTATGITKAHAPGVVSFTVSRSGFSLSANFRYGIGGWKRKQSGMSAILQLRLK